MRAGAAKLNEKLAKQENRDLISSVVLVLGFLVAGVFGYWGWSLVHHQYPRELHGELKRYDATFMRRIYSTLQLFVLHPQELPEHIPWQLETARFMAPVVLVLATLAVITTQFSKRIRRMWFRHRSHVIVCGAGVHGTRLAKNLVQDRQRVILVDIDEKAPGMQGPEHTHESRLVADTVRRDTLLRAGARRATRLIAVTGDDVVNSQIASTVRTLAGKREVKRDLNVLVQAEDAALARFLEDWSAHSANGAGKELGTQTSRTQPASSCPTIEIFGANAIAAEALFGGLASPEREGEGEHNATLADLDRDGGYLLLAGDHPLLQAIFVAALRRRRARRLRDGSDTAMPVLRITIIGPEAESRLAALVQHWHPEPTIVETIATDIDLHDEASILTSRWLPDWCEAQRALVACEEELESIALAVALSRALGREVELTRVRTQPHNELDEQLEDHTRDSSRLARIEVRSIADLAWDDSAARIDQVSPSNRLAAALRAEGVKGSDADLAAEHVLKRRALGIHTDPAPRLAPATARLVEGLLGAVCANEGDSATMSVSALVRAGLAVDLDSVENLRMGADRLSKEGSSDAFAAWCEYARRLPPDAKRTNTYLETNLLAPARAVGETGAPLRLRAAALGAEQALAELEYDADAVGVIRSLTSERIAIFAGGAASMSDKAQRAAAAILEPALQRYDGLILTGGSDVGLCGVVRAQADANGVPVLGYAPAGRGGAGAVQLRTTPAGEFSEAEPVAMWADILMSMKTQTHAKERSAGDVRVVAFPGGPITIAEILLARALGATVGWVDPDEESTDELYETLPFGAEGVIVLPWDSMTLRAFLIWPNKQLAWKLRETVARSLHSQYRDEHRRHKRPDDPALATWDRLPPALKRSNRGAADDIPNKLHVLGKRLVEGGSRLVLDETQVELLAEMEHGRFNCERLSAGWELGQDRDVSRLISPYLTPWSELDDKVKQWDRDAVCAIDGALSEAGWGVTDEQPTARPVTARLRVAHE
ncbi:MAG TPA: NAD-binding protein [Solirubrobacteraceae bacterium]|nr:NAD-binding protein [Solirubrobacteraceae bacterium]